MTQPTSAQPVKKKPDTQGSIKETLESILVAFILAFIFRAFVVEAFVIPTGSMATTLLGAHMRFRCNDCGYQFTVNYNGQQPSGDLNIPPAVNVPDTEHIVCPNCGYRFPTVRNPSDDPTNSTFDHPVHYGDRILVLKYLYLFQDPQRWDVVVFKSPDREPNGGPPTYTQNYIKRLIGKPGESIMVLDGDIYIGKHQDDPLTDYVVQTKPRYAQSALWRVIYDNDYYAHGVERPDGSSFKQPWTVRTGNGWNLGSTPFEGRTFHFDNSSGESTLFFDKDANPNQHAFTDWLSYDADAWWWMPQTVHDLKVSFFYQRKSGEGPLNVKLGDGRRKFVARLTPLQATLLEVTPNGEQVIGSGALRAGSGPVRVEFTNVDYQVTLRIDDRDVAQTTRDQYHPDIPRLLADYEQGNAQPFPSVEISAADQSAALSHIGLWRDVYYLNRRNRDDDQLKGTPHKPMKLNADEFFVMGDNSVVSSDARYWTDPIDLPADHLHVGPGRVPARFMLGRAFFVYWPAGFQPAPMMPSLAPNFGDMRFIR